MIVRSPRSMSCCCSREKKKWIINIGCFAVGFLLGFVIGYFPFPCSAGETAEAVAEARAPSTEAETKSSTTEANAPSTEAETKSSTAKTKTSTAKTKSPTAEADAPIIEVETESSTTAINMSDPHEAIARELQNLRSLGCRPRLTSVYVIDLLKAKDDLKDKNFKPRKVTAKCCSDSQSFCETRGHRCVPSKDGVRKKKFAVEFEEDGQTHTRWREVWEEVACECRRDGGSRQFPCSN
ncbi:uncharacterized protein [Penaeus vannamei]|uniref:uncharacterized protein n=1 Tax=Penaeus vannamei TaxID=6689 RepID=UPI00387FB02B